MHHLMNTYARLPVAFVRGEGVWLYDDQGKRYLDALAGIAVSTLGHAHPALTRAIAAQAATLIHTSNLYRIPAQEALADRLCGLAGMQEAFFCNSGAEANEAAIKLARLYGHQKGVENPSIVVMERAFHGRTLATLSATGNRKVQAGFEPLVGGFVRVPFDDLAAVEQVAANNRDVVAVLVEAIQGEGGVNVAHRDYLEGLRRVCSERGWLLMFDEVQCGTGRTGRWFAFQHSGVVPDVLTLAKGLASGVPIGACLAAGAAARVFKPGNHGSTFGGNPLACTAALATVDAIESEGLLDRAARLGEAIREGFRTALAGLGGVVDIRGDGLMVGIELDRDCTELVARALARGLLINVTAHRVIRLLPPLVFEDEHARALVDGLSGLIREFLAV
ncbi:MAG: aspartate aminotransferase family protein [Rhodocyclales bacterium CG_4_10_14_3_um_filter_68_10]|nr:MAG: aspartate aminotransferase family protein [Rhodocyclales bacterium CG_4_10_14_3_um_filter_68_10]